MFTSAVIFVYPNDTNESLLYPELCTIFYGNIISALMVWFMIFIHWKKGSTRWQRISPYIFFIFFYSSYLVIPVVNIAVFLYYVLGPSTFNVRDQPITSYMICFMVLYTFRLAEFYIWIRKTVIDDAKIHMLNREIDKDKSLSELQSELEQVQQEARGSASAISRVNTLKFLVNEKMPYMKRIRGYGQGELRIGQSLDFTEDIFSLCFCVQLDDNLLDPLFDVVKGKILCEELEEGEDDDENPEKSEDIAKEPSSVEDPREDTPLMAQTPFKSSLNAVEDTYEEDEAPQEFEMHNWADMYQERQNVIKL